MQVPAAVKKRPGRLILSDEVAQWVADTGETQSIKLVDVTGMQATPPTSAKPRIKLSSGSNVLMLEFSELSHLETARNCIQLSIKSVRERTHSPAAAEPETPKPAPAQQQKPNQPQPAAARKRATVDLNPKKLLHNLELQRQILKAIPGLMATFQETVIKGALTNEQFWELRMDLLITSAQERAQVRGSYNVLSTIKPVTGSDNQVNISLTREKITDIFDQYPIVRKAYNDNVPSPMPEGLFWQRFFQSKLFRTLKGEKVNSVQPDSVLDRYITLLDEQRKRRKLNPSNEHVPLFLDTEGNAEDNPETLGNLPDFTMRLDDIGDGGSAVGLIRSMNSLSQRLLVGKWTKADARRTDENMEQELRLEDLENPPKDSNTVSLKVRTVSSQQQTQVSDDKHTENDTLCYQLLKGNAPINLEEICEDDACAQVQSSLNELLEHQLVQQETGDQHLAETDAVTSCHATTQEFLRHFWRAQTQNQPTKQFRQGLRKSLDRIAAVLQDSGSFRDSVATAMAPLVKAVECALETPMKLDTAQSNTAQPNTAQPA